MKLNRRQFLKRSALLSGLAFFSPSEAWDNFYKASIITDGHKPFNRLVAFHQDDAITARLWSKMVFEEMQKVSYFNKFVVPDPKPSEGRWVRIETT
jgi:hypothetical protein